MTQRFHRRDDKGEMAVSFDSGRRARLLVIAPFFEEHNKLRRQIVAVMRRLDNAEIDSILPDLPGCNESLVPLVEQSLAEWRAAVASMATVFRPTHVLTVRGGTLLLPEGVPGFAYAPVKGRQILRAMLRARIIAAREAGREEKTESLLELGRTEGLDLARWQLGAAMIRDLESAEPPQRPDVRVVEQADLGGPPLWLRAEPDEDTGQADALATILIAGMAA